MARRELRWPQDGYVYTADLATDSDPSFASQECDVDEADPEQGLALRVIAALTGDLLCEIAARPTMTLASLKTMVEFSTGIESFEQKLIWKGSPLGDDAAILGPGMFAQPIPVLELFKLDKVAGAAEKSRQLVLARVKEGKSLRDLDSKYHKDREVVLAAAQLNVCQLQHADAALTYDGDFMLAAMAIGPVARCYAAAELWLDRNFVYQAVQLDGLLLEYAPTFSNDLDIVFEAVSNNGYALRHAGFQARSSKTVVLAAVQQKGTAICHAAPALKEDREVVLAAVQCEKMAVVHAKGGLRKDPEVLYIVEQMQRRERQKWSCGEDAAPAIDENFAVEIVA